MDLTEIGFRFGIDSSGTDWARWLVLENMVINLRVLLHAADFLGA
jgi:hypothetical protein